MSVNIRMKRNGTEIPQVRHVDIAIIRNSSKSQDVLVDRSSHKLLHQ